MRTHVDWLTFTIPMLYGEYSPSAYATAIANGIADMFGVELRDKLFGGGWKKNDKSRAPYTDSWTLDGKGTTLFASPNLTHSCIEISGKGCEVFISSGDMGAILKCCSSRTTRIDIACDIETDISPPKFVKQKSHKRMQTSGHYVSSTGETCYVGSQKSDRFCRVYRYNPPHPRHKLLRIEYVFRRQQAKIVAIACYEGGTDAVSRSAYRAFGFSHPVGLQPGNTHADITVVSDNHNGGNTVFWLVDTVAPCFKKLVREGVIRDAEEFIARYFLTE